MNRSLRSRLERLAPTNKPKMANIEYDSLEMTDDEAVQAAFEQGLIGPDCVLVVFAKNLTNEQWHALLPLWTECFTNGANWDELPWWAGGSAMVPKLNDGTGGVH